MSKDDQKNVNLTLPKNFNITMIEGVYQQIESELAQASVINLDGAAIEKVDSTAIQLLVSLKKYTAEHNQSLNYLKFPEVVSKTAKQLGLQQMI
ncbi:STAS domain-containing protein [Marinicellulosiphila megalodicopiae]|uniref:STAS domain-containing protein n=1 Tax=Marinicellulosiphila megalodicopiae TaxID=2724896 RepID=UPI003BB208BF